MSYDVELVLESSTTDAVILVFDGNYTSNCAPMWRAAGCDLKDYQGWKAGDLEGPLRVAIETMRNDPDKFRAMNPENGWGDYDSVLSEFLEPMLKAAEAWPEATVEVSA